MSDDITIPREPITASGPATFTRSYRARRTGMDTTTRRMLLLAGGLAAALVAGMGLWALRGPHQAGIPTIEADSSPLRVKPENPGGMSAIGLPATAADAAPGAGGMAPPAERPDPQALLAQQHALAPPAPAASEPPVAVPSVAAPSVAAPPVVAPLATPSTVPTPAPVPTAPATDAATSRPAASPAPGGAAVQLAAVSTEAAANAEWARLQKKVPELLGGRHLRVERVVVSGKTLWRVRTDGFRDMADATLFCRKFREKGLACALATF